MHIGILQTGHAPDPVRATKGDYADMFRRLLSGPQTTFSSWDVVDMDFPPGIHAADGWLITGSRHGAYEDHPFIPPLQDFIREVHAAGKPLVGICFGHQIVAQALGGTVEKFQGGWSVGRRAYEWEGETLHLNAWHQDQVTRLPEGARVLASNAACDYAALAYGDHVLTIQPHPEFDDAVVSSLIEHRGPGIVPEACLEEARAGLGTGTDSLRVGRRIVSFFREAHRG